MMASRFKFARNFSVTQQQVDILWTGTEMLNPCIWELFSSNLSKADTCLKQTKTSVL